QCLHSISTWITASRSWNRFSLFVCMSLSSIMVICILTSFLLILPFLPSSTLFPYTTLFRSHSLQPQVCWSRSPLTQPSPSLRTRSEEHTSELQSRGHIVCRLLLEKKTNVVHPFSFSAMNMNVQNYPPHVRVKFVTVKDTRLP